jgi:hypothetical protein
MQSRSQISFKSFPVWQRNWRPAASSQLLTFYRFAASLRCGILLTAPEATMAIDLKRLDILIEQLRKAIIGEPVWLADKEVFEFDQCSPAIVAVLKLVRAAHGVSALDLLCKSGLFIDAGAIMRCITDCNDEIFFLLENYPDASPTVWKFVRGFFEATIDAYLEGETPPVETKKIRAAVVRVLKGRQDDTTQKLMERIYKAFCGYVHANYAHIMEVYNGSERDFNLGGVPSDRQRRIKSQYVQTAAVSVCHSAAFIAQTFQLNELQEELMKLEVAA